MIPHDQCSKFHDWVLKVLLLPFDSIYLSELLWKLIYGVDLL